MNLETMAQIGEFAGGVGVIVTLIYLAAQVRANTSSQRADMTARVLERMAVQQHTFAFDPEANKLFQQGISDPKGLTAEERTRFSWLMMEFLSSIEFLMHQYNAGNVDPETWTRWIGIIDYWLSFPGFRTYWLCRPVPYTESFTAYIDERMTASNYTFNQARWNEYRRTGESASSVGSGG